MLPRRRFSLCLLPATCCWDLPEKRQAKMQKFSFTAFSLNDSAKFRPYFGVQTQNLQHSAPHWQSASGLTLTPHFLTDTSYQNAHKTFISLSWAFPKHAGRWLQHEFGSDECAISSYAWPREASCIVGYRIGHGLWMLFFSLSHLCDPYCWLFLSHPLCLHPNSFYGVGEHGEPDEPNYSD